MEKVWPGKMNYQLHHRWKSVDHCQITVVYTIAALEFHVRALNEFHPARYLGYRSWFNPWVCV